MKKDTKRLPLRNRRYRCSGCGGIMVRMSRCQTYLSYCSEAGKTVRMRLVKRRDK